MSGSPCSAFNRSKTRTRRSERSRGVDFNTHGFPVEVIDHVEQPESPALIERIAHEIRRPHVSVQTRPLLIRERHI
jgi:hypothetical protein